MRRTTGSVLGSFKFVCYTEDVCHVFQSHNVEHHLFADDKQLYAGDKSNKVDVLRQKLTNCCNDIATWCASRRLQLKGAKSDLIWFGSKPNFNKLSGCNLAVGIGTDVSAQRT
jgi:hypothetical protein